MAIRAYDYDRDVAPATEAGRWDSPDVNPDATPLYYDNEGTIMLKALRKLTIAGVAALTLAGTMAAGTDTAQAFYRRGGFHGGYGFHGGFGRFGYGRFGYGRFGYGGFGPYGFRRFGNGFGYPGFYGYGFRRAFFGGPGFYGPYGYGGFYGPRRFF